MKTGFFKNSKSGKLIFILIFLLYISLIKTEVSWNDGSRFAALDSIVERGTFAIDDSSFFNVTKDKIFYKDHFYSDKAPGLIFISAPFYFILHLFGLDFSSILFDTKITIFLLNLVVALFSALLIYLFYDSLTYPIKNRNYRFILTFALALASGIVVYSGVFVSHNVAAFFIFSALYFVLRATKNNPRKNLFIVGLMGGLAILTEYSSFIPLFFVFVYGFYSLQKTERKNLIFLLPSIILFGIIILLYNYSITENPFVSPYFYLHNWEGSPFSPDENVPSLERITFRRFFSMFFFGEVPRSEGVYFRGLFIYSPILLLSLLFIFSIKNFKRKENLFLLATLVFSLFYLTLTEVTGGCNYLNRYLIPVVPLLMFVIAINFEKNSLLRKSFYILLPYSVFTNIVGSLVYPLTCSKVPILSAIDEIVSGGITFSIFNYFFVFVLAMLLVYYLFLVKIRLYVRMRRL